MTGFKEYDDYDAPGLATLVRNGEVSGVPFLLKALHLLLTGTSVYAGKSQSS